MAVKLSLAALNEIRGVGVPAYAPRDLKAGWLHLGVGNFHRAHQAFYLDRLLNDGKAADWAIVGAGVTEHDRRMRAALQGQDWLTTLVEQAPDASSARITGAMVDFLPVGDRAALLAKLADPAIRIVSLTVTEGGYFLDSAGRFDPSSPAIVADGRRPEAPETVFGLILAGLTARRAAGVAPFAVMSCDNIPGNGHVAEDAVAGLAALSDPALADWVRAEVAFPNSMVDRITPATGDREREIARETFGVDDARPVFCEDFVQWVLEDRFPSGRPPLEAAGVEFVAGVAPWELMKIRILNGGHAVIAYPGGLLGIEFVHDAMAHPLIRAFLDKVEREEIIPVVPPVPGVTLTDYYALIARRFANPKIGDTIRRLCLDGSNRQPKFIVPSVADRLRAGAPVTGLALESALWRRYVAGVADDGAAIAPNDPNWDALQPVARDPDPMAWLGMEGIYGETGRAEPFRAAFAKAAAALETQGTARTLEAYLGDRL